MISDVITSFEKALMKLGIALGAEKTELNRDAAIQRFEFSYELMWKSLKSVLKDSGLICNSPKACFKEAFNQGWIKNEDLWLDILMDRNLTTQTYDEALAEKVYQRLGIYHQAMVEMLGNIKK